MIVGDAGVGRGVVEEQASTSGHSRILAAADFIDGIRKKPTKVHKYATNAKTILSDLLFW
jgi:hypothetical protein